MTEHTVEKAKDTSRLLKKTIFALILGGMAGFCGALVFLELGDRGTLGQLGPSEEIAGLVGMLYALTGLAIATGLIAPEAGAKFLNVEDAEEIREQRAMLICSTVVMIVLGAVLILAALAAPGGIVAPHMVALAFLAAVAITIALSIWSWRYQDELMRSIGRQTGQTAFHLIALVGGSWALMGHLGYVAAPAPLDWLTMIWASMLCAAFGVVAKHGMLKMR